MFGLDPSVHLPKFFSTDISRIPSVGLQHVDISMLLQEMSALRAKVRSMTQVSNEIADIGQVLGSTRLRDEIAADNDRGSADAATARELQHVGMNEKLATKTSDVNKDWTHKDKDLTYKDSKQKKKTSTTLVF